MGRLQAINAVRTGSIPGQGEKSPTDHVAWLKKNKNVKQEVATLIPPPPPTPTPYEGVTLENYCERSPKTVEDLFVWCVCVYVHL